ncbi:hypothetical protein B0H21DRAFT_759620, partial [Amylocystis lapponica]
MRERRRKETREKIRQEEEAKGRKGKNKDKAQDKGPQAKLLVSEDTSKPGPSHEPRAAPRCEHIHRILERWGLIRLTPPPQIRRRVSRRS